jgi:hypothetical protein
VTVNGNAATVAITRETAVKGYRAKTAGGFRLNGRSPAKISGCWGNPVAGGQPWAFLPLCRWWQAVTFLDYPPNARCTSNYLSNSPRAGMP